MRYDAIIIGGGAAGLFCAITAAKRGRRVLVIEHNAEVGRKIIISGGGRCNFTNTNTTSAPQTSSCFTISIQEFLFIPFVESTLTSSAFNHLPARAPPVA